MHFIPQGGQRACSTCDEVNDWRALGLPCTSWHITEVQLLDLKNSSCWIDSRTKIQNYGTDMKLMSWILVFFTKSGAI